MGAQPLGRRALRRLSRIVGRPVVFANTYGLITTTVHLHPIYRGRDDLGPGTPWGPCDGRFSSCGVIFGADADGNLVHFMRGACTECAAGPGELHRASCPRLSKLLGMIPADYWPKPVHLPFWQEELMARRGSQRERR